MTIIYEVNLEVDADARDAFSQWLPEHVARVLACPGFIEAEIETEERAANLSPAFCVRYRLDSRQALEDYFHSHAERMRQEGLDRFGERFRATRRILKTWPDGPITPEVRIERIAATLTYPLRQAVLRPHQTADHLLYPDDDAPDTGHLGAFLQTELLGIASVYRQSPSGEVDDGLWRLRGMAVRPESQGRGIGSELLQACLDHVAEHAGNALWCNARTSAAGFYRRLGFEAVGDPFELEGLGPHFLMRRVIARESPRTIC
jgi:GNAT superfamily N-acetyltransferase/quinol monooxygenase YgiN